MYHAPRFYYGGITKESKECHSFFFKLEIWHVLIELQELHEHVTWVLSQMKKDRKVWKKIHY